ncbi:Zinc finger and SCAN domain-containing protein 4 [Myotis davidii]|uniref:Zinc finger and SCAN domain-containing protein 4 n=1 Tax=Myotis davidii TaxID=225400 RepID=L5LM69_MYODS|nr:Zinc finger and SCAN domain-containing protein 4 [Myotis davidii]
MASQDEPARNGPGAGNFTLRSRRGPVNQEGEEAEEAEEVGFPSPGLFSLNNGSHGHGVVELRGIFWSFCSWLQPDTHTKQEMIYQLLMEQFLLNRPSSERAAWQERWELSGRDMEAFMEHLGDEVLRSPSMVHVSMGEQEALFSENMPIGQVLDHLQEQRSAAAATGTPSPTPPETPRPAAPGDEDGDNLSSPDHQPPFMLIPEEESPQGPAESEVSGENPRSSGSASPGAPTAQEEPPIHAEEKPFRCGRCGRAFSHRTNLRAHERIHPGAKPYACAQCGRTYRQSSTYHRHLRMHQRKASESGASTPGDTTSEGSTSRDSMPRASMPRASKRETSMPGASSL